jgi:glycosyltransferase involved in cell wall biosynthesis
VHPQITTKVKLPPPYQVAEHRPARIFFGGNTEQGKYDKNVLREVYHMLTRREMLEATAAVIPAYRPLEAASWLASSDFHPFVLCETQHCKIPPERWLEALGKADFFLACPGVGMPLCHNLIEALAAGSIPILQYATYLPHPLEDGVNCLVFCDTESLRKVIGTALAMSPENIRTMRANVRNHYEEFLAPGTFANRLLTKKSLKTILLMNSYRVPR